MVKFAIERDKKNRKDLNLAKSKKKGSRELNNLTCSINYDRAKGDPTRRLSTAKGGKLAMGDDSYCQ